MERVAVLEARISNLAENLETKHRENRRSIHDLRDGQQTMVDGLHRIELKIARAAGWAAGVGAVVALAAHFIDKI